MTIETNQYIATPADVEKLALSILSSDQTAQGGRGTYLKALVATTQADLGAPPRMRNVRSAKLETADATAHLAAFEAVFKRFHEAVVKAAGSVDPKPDSEALRSRTAFSRSAASTVRGYIRAGNDVRSLAAHKVTKAELATPHSKRKFSVESLKKRAETVTEELVSIARNLNAANHEIAQTTLRAIMAQLAEATGMLEGTTKDVSKAVEAGEAFHTKTGVFLPIDLGAVREQRRLAA